MASIAPRQPDLLRRRLAAEWQVLRHDPAALAHAAHWQLVEPAGRAPDDLDVVLDAIGFARGPRPGDEARLRHLVVLAATDPLAARVVLQRILPGIAAVARRRADQLTSPFGELVGAAWMAIVTFDPVRRPRCLSAALIGDADHHAYKRHRRRAAAGEVPLGTRALDLPARDDVDAAEELADVIAIARPALAADDLALIAQLLDGQSTEHIAATRGVTARTIRNRRTDLTARLRAVTAAA